MKKLGLGILIGIVVLALSGVAVAISNQGAEKSKAPDLEKIEFIHWKKGFGKPTCNNNGICEPELGENASCADCKTAEEPAPTTCYAFLGKYGKTYLKWTTLPVSYTINPTNPQYLSEDFVTSAVFNSAETWDAVTSKELMNGYTVDYSATYGAQDYENAIAFGDYPTEGVIAVTTVWYNPATKTIVEFDVMFDTDWTWGDATLDSTVMDLQNIATHELGHGVGLGDVYETACSEVTMYGYSNYGETQKRTLETPDITGLQTLYGK